MMTTMIMMAMVIKITTMMMAMAMIITMMTRLATSLQRLGSGQGVEELQQLAVLHRSSSVGALDQTHDDPVGHEHHSEDILVQRHVLLVGPDQVELHINALVLHAQDHVVLAPLNAGDIGPLRDGTKIDHTQAILLVLLVDPQHLP